jgi:hypothetical protein
MRRGCEGMKVLVGDADRALSLELNAPHVATLQGRGHDHNIHTWLRCHTNQARCTHGCSGAYLFQGDPGLSSVCAAGDLHMLSICRWRNHVRIHQLRGHMRLLSLRAGAG